MRAGRLRHRIDFEAMVKTTNSIGGDDVGWTVVYSDVPAEVMPLSAKEYIAAGEIQGELSAKVTIRTLPGIVDTMRIVHDGVVYTIKGIMPDPTFKRHLTIMVGGGVSRGE